MCALSPDKRVKVLLFFYVNVNRTDRKGLHLLPLQISHKQVV